ncbi:chaplin [Streptomyces sp. ASQP_92]|uniref:chaplin n=1 Tax=Streptomyces sp. ASQP_92 TaxID=2979116 RepID=UPI0021BE267D|nr:chaplin [Streptomyces sp. ASQP_92]MCT9090276.1 chaplin [Streptomyces sp. ASQP_92]
MRRVAMKGLVTAVATGGVLAATGYAYADSNAAGSADSSPGVLAGNAVQLPVHIPVNVCGNTVDVLGLLNPSAGNTCANASRAAHAGRAGAPRAAGGGAHAVGGEQGSPGVLAGNGLKLPVDLPVNISGNSIGVVGVLNPALGNTATNQSAPPPVRHHPAPPPPAVAPPAPPAPAPAHPVAAAPQRAALAHTGADGLGLAVPASAALLLGGGVLYRRFRGATR